MAETTKALGGETALPTQDPMFLQIWAHTVLMITSIVVKAAYDLPCAFGLHFCPAGISKENAKGDG